MASPAPTNLADLLNSIGEKSITLAELLTMAAQQGFDYRVVIGQTVSQRTIFWRRLNTAKHDPERVELALRPFDLPAPAAAGQLSSGVTYDPTGVSDYMRKVLHGLQPCPNVPPEVKQAASDEFDHYKAELAKGSSGSTDDLSYKIDQDGRTISVSGLVSIHAQRDKDSAPTPSGGKAGKQPGDHKGHLFAATFAANSKAADAFLNVVWEAGQINLSYKKRFETAVSAFAKKYPACVVTTIHQPLFHPQGKRPFGMTHYVVVDGVVVGAVILDNN